MAKKITRVSGHGLQYREKVNGEFTVYWIAPASSKFTPRTINLSKWVEFPNELIRRAEEYNEQVQRLKSDMGDVKDYGKFSYILRRYETDASSPFYEVSESTRDVYRVYMLRLKREIGNVHLESIISTDIIRWFNSWSDNRKKVPAGRMCLAVMNAIITYGVSIRVDGCLALKEVMRATTTRLPSTKKRTQVVTAEQVVELRKAAHEDGRPSSALTYALVFETLLRLFDVHQQLDWSHISDDLVLNFVPTKTAKRTGAKVIVNLQNLPFVMDELAPTLKNGKPKSGPIILNEATGERYHRTEFSTAFRKHAKKAGVPDDVLARDLRASGITEARMYGTDIADLAKQAGHSSSTTTSAVYDRALREASDRVAINRSKSRSF